MFRVFVVDDNKYERNGIINSIDWDKLDTEIAGAFSNGAKALEQIDILKPHIIITDVAMPVMNGIQMSELIRKTHPDIHIIFISCHSDFEYAKSAVGLGIYRYVLKPIISHELELAVKELLDKIRLKDSQQQEKEKMIRQVNEMLPMVQEQFFKELLLGNFHNSEDIEGRIDFLKINIHHLTGANVMMIKINSNEEESQYVSVADSYFVSYCIKNIISSYSTPSLSLYSVQFSVQEFAVIFFCDMETLELQNTVEHIKQKVMDIAVGINMDIAKQFNLTITIGISKFGRNLLNIPVLYRQAYKAINTKFFSDRNPILLYEEVEGMSEGTIEAIPDLESVYQDVKELLSYGENGDNQGIMAFIEKYLDPEDFKPDENYVKGFISLAVNIASIILMESNYSFQDIFGDNILVWKKLNQFETIVDVKQWTYNIFLSVKEYLASKSNTRNTSTVKMIKETIKNRFHEQITIEDISKSVYLSPRYANSIFKKETDETIYDYLMEYRIEIAKKLLRKDDSKVALVAEAVGYRNTSYFSLSFKKNVGMTPAEYKNKAII